jgi:hypothetical protein
MPNPITPKDRREFWALLALIPAMVALAAIGAAIIASIMGGPRP